MSVTQSGGSTDVTEGGATDTLSVVLTGAPSADVTVTLTPDGESDLGSGVGAPHVLTFTTSDWDQVQVVTVTANDDGVVEGPHTSTITYDTASADPIFNNLGSSTVVSDSFTEAVDTDLTAHTPDTGIAWTELYDASTAGTDATIDAALDVVRAGSDENGVAQGYTAGPAPTGVDQSISFTLSAIDTTSGTEPIGVFGRTTGTNDSYYLQILPNANSEDSLKLFKAIGGVPTELGTIDVTIAAGDTFKLEITDATKKVYHNGTEVISSTDNAVTAAGTWGFYIGGTATGGDMSAAWHIDDFVAEEPVNNVIIVEHH